MASRVTRFRSVKASLKDLVGADYVAAVCRARAFASGESPASLRAIATQKVDFFPRAFQDSLLDLLPRVGRTVVRRMPRPRRGAGSLAFSEASHAERAPLTGFGYYRIAEEGKLWLVSKSEHYHAAVGHAFPGYRLLEHARKLGIANATHNNTRGTITRRLEEELIQRSNGITPGDTDAFRKVLASRSVTTLNRVLNLETGSLAVEAAIKMILLRFHRIAPGVRAPVYHDRVPVVLVMGNDTGWLEANYHGTTVLTQLLRGMWPEWRSGMTRSGMLMVHAVRPNVIADLDDAFQRYEAGRYKVAAFLQEFTLMNYGARRLSEDFVRHAYWLCRRHDAATVADEIQSCVWCPGLFSFREYGVRPTFVVVGKGFPGGEYASSRLLFSSRYDNLPLFGALVTNGQQEIGSLAYLVTMRWAARNETVIRRVGDYYQERLHELADRHPGVVAAVDGDRHMGALRFHEAESAETFACRLNRKGLDISVQTYRKDNPPGALTKLPIIAGFEVVDAVITRMDAALAGA